MLSMKLIDSMRVIWKLPIKNHYLPDNSVSTKLRVANNELLFLSFEYLLIHFL